MKKISKHTTPKEKRRLHKLKVAKKHTVPKPTVCPYCGSPVIRIKASELFRNNSEGVMYACTNHPVCSAYVKEDPVTKKPLGTMADKGTRRKRQEAHYWFDQIYAGNGMTKSKAYIWLADEMHIRRVDCHIGMFNIEQCEKVIEICKEKLGKSQRFRTFDEAMADFDREKAEEREVFSKKKK